MRTHFNVVFEEEQNERNHHRGANEEEPEEAALSNNDKVNLNNFIGSLGEDEYFDE